VTDRDTLRDRLDELEDYGDEDDPLSDVHITFDPDDEDEEPDDDGLVIDFNNVDT